MPESVLTSPSATVEFTKRGFNSKSLQALSANNSTGMIVYRADYELYWLRKSRREVAKLGRLSKKCRTFAGIAALSRAMIEWCERERVLLRIKLPGVEAPREIAAQQSAPTIYEIDRSTTAPAVMNEQPAASPSTPAQPTSSTPGPGPGPATSTPQ